MEKLLERERYFVEEGRVEREFVGSFKEFSSDLFGRVKFSLDFFWRLGGEHGFMFSLLMYSCFFEGLGLFEILLVRMRDLFWNGSEEINEFSERGKFCECLS